MSGGGAREEQRPLLAQEVFGRHVGHKEVGVGEHHQAAVIKARPVRGEGAPLGQVALAGHASVTQIGGAPPAAPAAMKMITLLTLLALFVSAFVTLFRRGEDEW